MQQIFLHLWPGTHCHCRSLGETVEEQEGLTHTHSPRLALMEIGGPWAATRPLAFPGPVPGCQALSSASQALAFPAPLLSLLSFSTLSFPSSRLFCSLGHPPCLFLSTVPDPCLCFLSSPSLSPHPGPLRPGSDDAGVLVPQPLCPPHCAADQEDTTETQQWSPEAQSYSLAMGLKPDSPLPAVFVGWLVDGSLPG